MEDYHGRASSMVSIPFYWESQPGTPKSKFHQNHTTLPPLTPPPSYFYTSKNSTNPKTKLTKKSKSLVLRNVFPRLRSSKESSPSSPAGLSSSRSHSRSSSASSTSSVNYYSVTSSPVGTPMRNYRACSRSERPEFDSGILSLNEYEYEYGSSRVSATSGCCAKLIKLLLRDFHHH